MGSRIRVRGHASRGSGVGHGRVAAAGGRLGQIALGLAPAFLSDQKAADAVLARYANDIGCDVETVLAVRRYALTGDHRALEGPWL
ncbi:hypothetical protein AB0P36_34780 [Streptomyces flavidovirens]|uniref:hypothetical protein n=1 Tax=Streptomyces flavidovirens TaxID=67298 RepID=UPI0034451086